MKQNKFGALSADDWCVRTFSKAPQNVSPNDSVFEAQKEQQSWPYKLLDLSQPNLERLGPSTQEEHRRSCRKSTHATFSSQLNAFIPAVVILVNV